MYESPIKIIQNQYDEFRKQVNEGVENQVMEVIHCYGVVVDKNELVKALRYDRRQYEKGYADGKSGRWIPCKERLPNDGEPVEVYCCDTHGEQLIACPFEDENSDTGFSAESEGCFMYDCIAWMPPFEPYKENENEQTEV